MAAAPMRLRSRNPLIARSATQRHTHTHTHTKATKAAMQTWEIDHLGAAEQIWGGPPNTGQDRPLDAQMGYGQQTYWRDARTHLRGMRDSVSNRRVKTCHPTAWPGPGPSAIADVSEARRVTPRHLSPC